MTSRKLNGSRISKKSNKVKDTGFNKLNLASARLVLENIKKLYRQVEKNKRKNVLDFVFATLQKVLHTKQKDFL